MKAATFPLTRRLPAPDLALNRNLDRAEFRIRIDGMDEMFRSYVDQWIDYLRGESSSPRTVNTYAEGVMRFWQFLSQTERSAASDPLEATSQDMTTFKLWMASTIDARTGRPYSEATQANRWRSVQAFYRWIVKIKRELTESPMANLRPPKITRTPPPTIDTDDIRRMIASCSKYLGQGVKAGTFDPESFRDGRDRALLFVFYDCGLRLSEVANMRMTDIDLLTGQIKVLGKGRKERKAQLGQVAKEALLSYLRRNRVRHPGKDEPWLWLGASRRGRDGWHLTDSGIYQALLSRATQVGLEDFHPHLLRHTGASADKQAGMSQPAMMAKYGWESPQMYLWYGAADDERLAREEQLRFSPADRL